MVPGELEIEVRRESGRTIVALVGELDLSSAGALRDTLADDSLRDGGAVVVDLDELEFIDSTGLSTILSAREDFTGRGQEFALTRGSAQVQRLLRITGVGDHVDVVDSLD